MFSCCKKVSPMKQFLFWRERAKVGKVTRQLVLGTDT